MLIEGIQQLLSTYQELISIVLLTLQVTISSTFIAAILGTILGYVLTNYHGHLVRLMEIVLKTLMGLPPVVIGLFVYLLLSRNGSLAFLQLLYTPTAMIIAQVIVITPIIAGLTYTSFKKHKVVISALCLTLGGNKFDQIKLLLSELRFEMYTNVMSGFSRAISEVGAVMIVGGNIAGKTRMMTTTISMLQSRGDSGLAIVLGVILILLAFLVQVIIDAFRKDDGYENF